MLAVVPASSVQKWAFARERDCIFGRKGDCITMQPVLDYERLRIRKVVDALAQGDEPHLLTGEQYKASLRDGRRVIASSGDAVADVTNHPDLRAVHTIGRVLDLQ